MRLHFYFKIIKAKKNICKHMVFVQLALTCFTTKRLKWMGAPEED